MDQNERVPFVGRAAGDAEKFVDAKIYRHANAADGTPDHDTFAVDFNMPDAAIGATIARFKADRQRMGVELQAAARPGGLHPTDSELTPHDFISHAGIMFPVDARRLPERCRNPLKKAG
jgi:hypothetical protein